MSNRYFETDQVSRISTGKAASESFRQERRARVWRAVGYALVAALVIGAGLALRTADARMPATVDAPPGPVCPDWGTRYHSCF